MQSRRHRRQHQRERFAQVSANGNCFDWERTGATDWPGVLPFTQPEPRLFVVRYSEPGDLAPGLQQPVVEAIVDASAKTRQATGVIFCLESSIRGVDMAVPNYWLGVTGRTDTGLKAMAIVTTSAAVRVAAAGFALANRARGLELEVRSFATIDAATSWVRDLIRVP